MTQGELLPFTYALDKIQSKLDGPHPNGYEVGPTALTMQKEVQLVPGKPFVLQSTGGWFQTSTVEKILSWNNPGYVTFETRNSVYKLTILNTEDDVNQETTTPTDGVSPKHYTTDSTARSNKD